MSIIRVQIETEKIELALGITDPDEDQVKAALGLTSELLRPRFSIDFAALGGIVTPVTYETVHLPDPVSEAEQRARDAAREAERAKQAERDMAAVEREAEAAQGGPESPKPERHLSSVRESADDKEDDTPHLTDVEVEYVSSATSEDAEASTPIPSTFDPTDPGTWVPDGPEDALAQDHVNDSDLPSAPEPDPQPVDEPMGEASEVDAVPEPTGDLPFVCGVNGCTEAFESIQKRGSHRRHGHPGWRPADVRPAGWVEPDAPQRKDEPAPPLPEPHADAPVAETDVMAAQPTTLNQPCVCSHSYRMHERDSLMGRGACMAGRCSCPEFKAKVG